MCYDMFTYLFIDITPCSCVSLLIKSSESVLPALRAPA